MFDWQSPPWHGGLSKYRLGLRPIAREQWFQAIPEELYRYKKNLLDHRYGDVVQVTHQSAVVQRILATHFAGYDPDKSAFRDTIADLSLLVADDLCLLEAHGEQRLRAASVCSPTYWNVRDKIGQSLARIHEPVTTLEEKIGDKVARSISSAPLLTPFERMNWFIHSDQTRFHLESEQELKGHPADWFVRSERETICRFHEDYALFTINVRFAGLKEIHDYPAAREDLKKSLASLDQDEIEYFGGREKVDQLLDYLTVIV